MKTAKVIPATERQRYMMFVEKFLVAAVSTIPVKMGNKNDW